MKLSKAVQNAIAQSFFYPRSATQHYSGDGGIFDGTIPVADEAILGYRLFTHTQDAPLVLYFHGNGEIAADYNDIATLYHNCGVSLLVVDFRGYGWSTGKPGIDNLTSDVEFVVNALRSICEAANINTNSFYVMGRSMGSAPAIQAATQHADQFKGVIIESGFASVMPLLVRRGMGFLVKNMPDPINNLGKIKTLSIPLLVIHGERDQLIPVEQGQMLYDAAPVATKDLLRLPNAGHNDMLLSATPYFATLATFVQKTA